MAIQLQAGSGVPTGMDDVMLMMQNGRLSDGFVQQVQQNLKDTQDCLETAAALIRQIEMNYSELSCLRQITYLNDSADRNATSGDALCVGDMWSKFCQLEMHYSEPPRSRQITYLNDSADRNATAIVARVALGFGFIWSKGSSFMDLMYVTLSTAILNLAEHLKQAARKHLTLGIENLDGEVQQQRDKSKSVRSDVRHELVNGVYDNLSQLGYDVDSLNQMVSHMKGKTMKSDEKQDPTNLRVWHLYYKADGHKISGKAHGPKALADNSFPGDGSVKSDNQPRWLTSYPRIVTRRNMDMKQFLKETEDNAKSCNRNYNLH